MGDYLQANEPYRYVTSHSGWLSPLSSVGWLVINGVGEAEQYSCRLAQCKGQLPCSTVVHSTNELIGWTHTMVVPQWRHHKHCHVYWRICCTLQSLRPINAINNTTVTLLKKAWIKAQIAVNGTSHDRDTGCYLPYGITQCYLLTTPQPAGRYSIYLPRRDGRLSWRRYPAMQWSRVKLATSRWQVQHHDYY